MEYELKEKNNEKKSKWVIIRADRAGVFFGKLKSVTKGTQYKSVVLKNVRRIFYWKGAASLSQMAVDGVSCPDECKFSVPVKKMEIMGVIEIIPATEKSKKSIQGVSEWKK